MKTLFNIDEVNSGKPFQTDTQFWAVPLINQSELKARINPSYTQDCQVKLIRFSSS